MSWETPPLEANLSIAGEVVAHLFAATTGSDADWIVKLIDVYPEHYPENWDLAGYQLMVSNEVFEGATERVSRSQTRSRRHAVWSIPSACTRRTTPS